MKVLSSYWGKLQTAFTLCVACAFLHAQMPCAFANDRLRPGEFPQTPNAQQQQPATPAQPAAPQSPPGAGQPTVVQVPIPKDVFLEVTVVFGEGASNVIRKRTTLVPIVEVRDEKNHVIEGAMVTFTGPADGPSFVFGDGLRTASVMTDGLGRAESPSFTPVNLGTFRIQVSAAFHGQTVNTSISQTNFETEAEAEKSRMIDSGPAPVTGAAKPSGGLSRTAWLLIIGAGAAVAVGVAIAATHKGGGSGSTGSTGVTIGSGGSPTVGAP